MRYLLGLLVLCVPLAAQEVVVTSVESNRIQHLIVDEPIQLILAKPKPTATPETVNAVAKRYGLKDKTKLKILRWKQFEVPRGKSKHATIQALRESGLFEHVQEDRVYKVEDTTPNDPFFPQLWGMTNIAANKAWDLMREAPNVIVAVVDTGIDFNHPDIAPNLWTGPSGEHGYEVHQGVVTPGGADDHGHGTHVSGTIAGVGNNGIGVTGISWRSKIMAMKILHGGTGSGSDIGIGLEKLISLKAAGYPILVSNHSYGGVGSDSFMQDAFGLLEQADIFAAVAAGNSNADIDQVSFVPAIFPFNNIISTVASDSNNERASFSNFGMVRSDIAAPGVGVLSCTRSNTYSSWNGTSMAAPHVCGVALLLRARNPSLSARATRDLILDPGSYDSFQKLSNNNTSARINLDKAIRSPRLFESPFKFNNPPTITSVSPYTVVTNAAVISFTASDPDGNSLRGSFSTAGSVFVNDFSGFFRNLTAKNGFALHTGSNNVTIGTQPFSYQLAGSLTAVVSDNRGGGDFAPSGFEVAKSGTVRRPIKIKTWTARVISFGRIGWILDVEDEAKGDYLYIFHWIQGFGISSWFNFSPSPTEFTATVPTSNVTLRAFVMDKYFNWVNTDPIRFPADQPNTPTCRATASVVEGNAPFEIVHDLSASTGPITHYLLTDFWSGGINQVGQRITNILTEPTVKFYRPMVLNSAATTSDSFILPVFSSRFAGLAITNVPPPPPTNPPPPTTNLVAVTDLSAAPGSGNTVVLRWTDRSTNEDRYVLEASHKERGNSSPYQVIATLPANADVFTHVPTVRRSVWTYRVKACGGQLCAPNSNLASIRVK